MALWICGLGKCYSERMIFNRTGNANGIKKQLVLLCGSDSGTMELLLDNKTFCLLES